MISFPSITTSEPWGERKPLSIATVDCTLRVAFLYFIARKFYYFSVRNVARLLAQNFKHESKSHECQNSNLQQQIMINQDFSHYWRKEILPRRVFVTLPFWIKNACQEEHLDEAIETNGTYIYSFRTSNIYFASLLLVCMQIESQTKNDNKRERESSFLNELKCLYPLISCI